MSPVRTSFALILTLLFTFSACGPDSVAEAVREGEAAFGQMDFAAAIDHFTRAIEEDPDNARAFEGRGASYFAMNRFDEAIADLDRALSLDADRGWAYFYRGSSYLNQERYEEAAEDLEWAAESGQLSERDVVRAYRTRSIAHMNLGAYEEAIADVTQTIDRAPEIRLGYLDRARLYEAVNDTAAALRDYEAYLAADTTAQDEQDQRVRARLDALRGEAKE